MQEYEGYAYSDSDPYLSKSPSLRDWIQLINEASSKFGKEFNIAPKLKKLMTDTGWVDVNQKVVHVSLAPYNQITLNTLTVSQGPYWSVGERQEGQGNGNVSP